MQIDRKKLNPHFEGYRLCSSANPLFYTDEKEGARTIKLSSPPLVRLQSSHTIPLSFKQSKQRYDFNHLFSFEDQVFFIDDELRIQRLVGNHLQEIYNIGKISQDISINTNDNIMNEEATIRFISDRIMIVNNGMGEIQILEMEQEFQNPRPLLRQVYSLDMSFARNSSQKIQISHMPSVLLGAHQFQDTIHVIVQSSFDFTRTKDWSVATSEHKRRLDFYLTAIVFKKEVNNPNFMFHSRCDIASDCIAQGCFFINNRAVIISEHQFVLKESHDQQLGQQQVPTQDVPAEDLSQEQISEMNDRLSMYTSEIYDTDLDMNGENSTYFISFFEYSEGVPKVTVETSSEVKPILAVQDNLVALSHDVHMCIFSIKSNGNSLAYNHEMTFNALSYIIKGKQQKRYVLFDESLRMCIIAEYRSNIYVYDANSTDKMNRSEHQLIDIGDEDIMGVQVIGNDLVVLSDHNLRVLPVNVNKLAKMND